MEKYNSFLKTLPKIELHLHLEGAIPLETLWELIKKYGGHKELDNNIENLNKRFLFKDFPHFIETWIWKNQFLKEYEDFEFIAHGVAKDLSGQNIRYAELFFTPGDHTEKGLELGRIVESVAKGMAAREKEIELSLIYDLCRDFGPEKGMEQLEKIKDLKSYGIIGIGIGGSEQLYPPEPFKKVYEKARAYGFRTTAHAGEAAGADSVWGAIRELKVDRIGHGTRSYEDQDLVAYLKETQLPIEVCPLSNVRTGVVNSVTEHPVKSYFKEGLNICINTDDPKMFNNSLEQDYLCLIDELGFSLDDIKLLLYNAVAASWCDDKKKRQLKSEIADFYDKYHYL
ncbi:MAG: adenosine deaminase [Spirochaetales bacterium]|nr:adenosine deaminase [Spirochaetales bacterium]